MSMYKFANDLENELEVSLPVEEASPDDVVVYDELPSEEEVVEMHAPTNEFEISFSLPFLPGAPDEVVEVSGDDLQVENKDAKEDKKPEKEKNDGKISPAAKDFLLWLQNYLQKIPKHKGETIALERAMSYLKKGLDHLSKAVQQDYEGEIDISKAEDARVEMESGIDRLDKELQKRRKKASKSSDLTKEAQKAPAVGGVIITVPLIVSTIARACINSTVSGGKDIEDTFKKLSNKYKLSDREQIEVIQLIKDMNFPMKRDVFLVDDEEKYGYSSENNYNYVPNYRS